MRNSIVVLCLVLIVCQIIPVQLSGNFVSGEETQRFPKSDTLTEDEKTNKPIRIGIIGAGIGGASTAYFLNELLKDKLDKYEIHIFEKNGKIGGRLATVEIDGNSYEAGGSIIHERNFYASYFSKKFDLKRRETFIEGQKNCIINGTDMVFCETDHEYIDIIKGAWRYGLDFITMKKLVKRILDDFDTIYKLQEQGKTFENLEELLRSMNPNFVNYTKVNYNTFMKNDGYRMEFINEILQSITLVNYGQTTAIPAFVGFVSFAGAGADLWSVRGGNKRLPENLIKESKAILHLNSIVSSVAALPNGKFKLSLIGKEDSSDVYDVVVAALPLTTDTNIQFLMADLNTKVSPNKYHLHHTKATFIKGVSLPKNDNIAFFSCNENNFITSVSEVLSVDDDVNKQSKPKSRIYKIFSGKELNIDSLKKLFLEVQPVEAVDWKAYPEYSLDYSLPSFKLVDGLYYVNAIEWAASAMEMSMIGGKNVALLTCKKLGVCSDNSFKTESTPKSDL